MQTLDLKLLPPCHNPVNHIVSYIACTCTVQCTDMYIYHKELTVQRSFYTLCMYIHESIHTWMYTHVICPWSHFLWQQLAHLSLTASMSVVFATVYFPCTYSVCRMVYIVEAIITSAMLSILGERERSHWLWLMSHVLCIADVHGHICVL